MPVVGATPGFIFCKGLWRSEYPCSPYTFATWPILQTHHIIALWLVQSLPQSCHIALDHNNCLLGESQLCNVLFLHKQGLPWLLSPTWPRCDCFSSMTLQSWTLTHHHEDWPPYFISNVGHKVYYKRSMYRIDHVLRIVYQSIFINCRILFVYKSV